jgi:hypothetical protein
MTPDDVDRADWDAARAIGRYRFIEQRITGFYIALGAALAATNALVGGSGGDYELHRLVLEGAFYAIGSIALGGLGAALERTHLRRRFERPVKRNIARAA